VHLIRSPVDQLQAELLGLLHETDFVGTAGLEDPLALVDDRSHVVADGERSHGVSEHAVLGPLELLDVLRGFLDDVLHGVGHFVQVPLNGFLYFLYVRIVVLHLLERHALEYHLVLREGA